jgi:hypothetical protein
VRASARRRGAVLTRRRLEAQDVGSRVVAEATGPKHANVRRRAPRKASTDATRAQIRLVKWQNDTTVEQHWRFQAVA